MITIREWKKTTHPATCSYCGQGSYRVLLSQNGKHICIRCLNRMLGSEGAQILRKEISGNKLASRFTASQPVELRYGMLLNQQLIERIPPDELVPVLGTIGRQLAERLSHPLKRQLIYLSMKLLLQFRKEAAAVLISMIGEIAADMTRYDPIQFSRYALLVLLSCAPQSPETRLVVEAVREHVGADYVSTFARDIDGVLISRYTPFELIDWVDHALTHMGEDRSDLELFFDIQAQMLARKLDSQYRSEDIKRIYMRYANPIKGEVNRYLTPLLRGGSMTAKNDLCQVLGYVFTIPALFKAAVPKLPPALQKMLPELLIGSGHGFVRDLSVKNARMPKDTYQRQLFMKKHFPLLVYYSSYYWDTTDNETCSYPSSLVPILRRSFADDTLRPLSSSDQPASDIVVEGFESYMQVHSLLVGYHQSVGVKYSKSGKNVLKSTLKEFRQVGSIPEPFGSDSKLDHLRTELVLKMLELIHPEASQGVELIEELYRKICSPYIPEAAELESLLPHLNMIPERDFDYHGFLNPACGIAILISRMKEGRWYSVEEMISHLVSVDLLGSPYYGPLLWRELFCSGEGPSSDSYYRGKLVVTTSNYRQVVQKPFVEMVLFLLNTIGILDLCFTFTENEYHLKNKYYLTGFDGISGFRLTSLGLKVLGLSDEYEEEVQEDDTLSLLDEHMLLVTLKGEDPIRKIFLEKVGKRVGEIFYVIDAKSFTKDCSTPEELNDKVNSFIGLFGAQGLPPIWQSFFAEILDKNQVLEIEYQPYISLIVDEKVRRVIAEDGKLGEHVRIAEGDRVFIATSRYSTVRNLLKKHGYILPDYR